jgi:class 3 adenylate cyclase
MAVHIGARVAGHAHADRVLVTGTVRNLTVGSGLAFVDRGEHELRVSRIAGICTPWSAEGCGVKR